MIPKKIYLNYVNENDEEKTWCEEPVHDDLDMQNRVYTDLSQIWHDANEEPKALRQVVAIDKKGVSFSGKYWPYDDKGYTPRYPGIYWNGDGCLTGARLLDWDSVAHWAYIDDLLPKGGER